MTDFTYTIKRSSRRSIGIKIDCENNIVVSAPLKCRSEDIERFVNEKRGWIDKHIFANSVKNDSLRGIIEYKSILVAGKELPFAVGSINSFSPDGVYVKSFKNLKKLYINNLGGRFLELFYEISQKTQLHYASIGFKDYKSRWGCCDRNRNILFNYKLLMLPEKYWAYVIVHELCHTVYMNHSQSFYSLMSSFRSDYKKARSEMKFYSRITSLY